MKIKVSAEIEIPDQHLVKDYEFLSAVQMIFDEIFNYALVSHLEDARKWMTMTGYEEHKEVISKHHSAMADFCRTIDWKYEEMSS